MNITFSKKSTTYYLFITGLDRKSPNEKVELRGSDNHWERKFGYSWEEWELDVMQLEIIKTHIKENY